MIFGVLLSIYSYKVWWSLPAENGTWTNPKGSLRFGCEYGRHHRWGEHHDWYGDEKTCLWAGNKKWLLLENSIIRLYWYVVCRQKSLDSQMAVLLFTTRTDLLNASSHIHLPEVCLVHCLAAICSDCMTEA